MNKNSNFVDSQPPAGVNKNTVIKEVALSLVKPNPQNPRVDGANEKELKQSLGTFNQQLPILVDQDYNIIAGHQRYRAAQALGWSTIACIVSDLNVDQARQYMIADNQTSAKGKWDFDKLQDLMSTYELDPETVGFDAYDIDAITKAIMEKNNTSQIIETDENLTSLPMAKDLNYLAEDTHHGNNKVLLYLDDDQKHEFEESIAEVATILKVNPKDTEFLVLASIRGYLANKR
jgi:ParB-like nuclease domain